MSVHIIGAGLAGLAAAVRLGERGRQVIVHEATDHAGGRCRSFFDPQIGRRIDNGNHLLLSGNKEVAKYINAIGAEDRFRMPERAVFPFLDLTSGQRWEVVPGLNMRIPGGSFLNVLSVLNLAWAGPGKTIRDLFHPKHPASWKFWEPLSIAVLNTLPEAAAASPLWPVIRQTFLKGKAACRPMFAKGGLSDSLVEPALRKLEELGVEVQFNKRLQSLTMEGGNVQRLNFEGEDAPLDPEDKVVLAVPPDVAHGLIPGLVSPEEFSPIVNAHFILPDGGKDGLSLGLVHGLAQWIFVRGDVASVTVSAAQHLVKKPRDEIAALLWRDVSIALNLQDRPLPQFRIVKEKRATIAQTPEQVALRPKARTQWANLFLAGDWTDTGLPATIEGAVWSGHRAATLVIKGR